MSGLWSSPYVKGKGAGFKSRFKLKFLILLLCPLIHLFMHGSHGGHGSHDHHEGHEHHHKQSDKHNDDAYRQGFEDGRRHKNKDHEGE